MSFVAFWAEKANDHQHTFLSTRLCTKRNLIVDRQKGTTMGLTAEAMITALETDTTQVFVAPTIAQALMVKAYAKHLGQEYGHIDLRPLMQLFRFESPITLRNSTERLPVIDLYVGDWLFMRDSEVEFLRTFVRRQPPNRNTWVSALPDLPKLHVLLGATQLT